MSPADEIGVSIIIPAYQAGQFIDSTVEKVLASCERAFASFEVIVVDDGSTDQTAKNLERINDSRLTIYTNPVNLGKFAAIRRGMLVSRGRCCIFTDADLPFGTKPFLYIARLVNGSGFHVVIGDRFLEDSRYSTERSVGRRLGTIAFSIVIRLLFLGGVPDSQCGLKGFNGRVGRLLMGVGKENRFLGDVEILYLALKYNLALRKIPVRLLQNGPSTVSPLRDAFHTCHRLIRLPIRWYRGEYKCAQLYEIADQKYWD